MEGGWVAGREGGVEREGREEERRERSGEGGKEGGGHLAGRKAKGIDLSVLMQLCPFPLSCGCFSPNCPQTPFLPCPGEGAGPHQGPQPHLPSPLASRWARPMAGWREESEVCVPPTQCAVDCGLSQLLPGGRMAAPLPWPRPPPALVPASGPCPLQAVTSLLLPSASIPSGPLTSTHFYRRCLH